MPAAQQELVDFLSQHPECHLINRSAVHMRILDAIEHEARSFNDLCSYFHTIDSPDLLEILSSLEKTGLIECFDTDGKHVYCATAKAKEFMQKFRAAKKSTV
ncbi:MAG: hypothetical protein V1676_01495 [Candidatus Diapherotrites archaeon]